MSRALTLMAAAICTVGWIALARHGVWWSPALSFPAGLLTGQAVLR